MSIFSSVWATAIAISCCSGRYSNFSLSKAGRFSEKNRADPFDEICSEGILFQGDHFF